MIDDGFCVIEMIFDAGGRPVDYRFLEVNPAFERQTGLVDAVGRTMKEMAPAHEQHWFDIYGPVAMTGEPARFEHEAAALGRYYEVEAFPIDSAAERHVAILFRDVTAQRRIEQALRESEAKYRTLFKSVDEGFCIAERLPVEPIDFRYLTANPAFERLTGLADPVGRSMRELVPEVEEDTLARYARVADGGGTETFLALGLDRAFEVEAVATDHPGQIAVLFRDITAARRAEAVLRESEERQSFLLRFTDAIRSEPNERAVVRRAVQMLAEKLAVDRCYATRLYPSRDLTVVIDEVRAPGLAAMPSSLRNSDFPEAFRQTFNRTLIFEDTASDTSLSDADKLALASMEFRALLSRPLRRDGHPVFALGAVSSRPRSWTPGEIALVEDVAERTWEAAEHARAESALAASEEKCRTIFDSIDEGFALIEVIFDDEGKPVDLRHLETNSAYERHTGLRNVVGKRALEIAPDFDATWFDFYGKVARTGEAARTESLIPPVDRWFTLYASRVGGEGSPKIAVVFSDITERKRAETVLRESEERQVFLLKLSDALRASRDAEAAIAAASRLLGERLGASRVIFGEIDEAAGVARLSRGWAAAGAGSHPAMLRLADFGGPLLDDLRGGRTVRYDDVGNPPYPRSDFAALAAIGIRAGLSVPLLVGGRFTLNLNVHQDQSRAWADGEIALAKEVAERTWAAIERARAEAAMRESEERQAFLLKLSDTLRAEPDADTMALLALRTLSERLQLDRCYIAEYHLEEDRGDIPYQVGNDRVPPFPDSVRLSDFPEAFEIALDRSLIIDDAGEADFLSDDDKRNMHALGIHGLVTSAARKGEHRPLFCIVAVSAAPRHWTSGEIALVEEVNERTWAAIEHARAEAALREIDARYRTLFENIDEGFCLAERVPGDPVDFRYLVANPAFERQTGFGDPVGKTIRGLVPGVEDEILERYREVEEGGVSAVFEAYVAELRRWFEVEATPTDRPGQIAVLFRDITVRKEAEAVLRESEERQIFLLKLSDALRHLELPSQIADAACQLLVEQLNATQAQYAGLSNDRGAEQGWVLGDYKKAGEPFPRHFPLAPFGEPILKSLRNGETVVLRDGTRDDRLNTDQADAFAAVSAAAVISVPLVKRGCWIAALTIQQDIPREWSPHEVSLTEDVAERTWTAIERARAEEALRESEERFREFGEKSSDVLWISDLEAMKLEYLSPSYEAIWGESRERVMADYGHWTETVHPDDVALASQAMPRLKQGESVVVDYRIVRPDGEIRWIRDTGFPMHRNGKVTRGGGIAQDVTDLRLAEQRQTVLVAELQHGVRNILTVVRSVFQRTMETTDNPDEVANHFKGRLDAMARTQVMATRSASRTIDLENLIRDELLSVGVSDGPGLHISGPDVALPFDTAESIALAIHELTTNALKYGALQAGRGKLSVHWGLNLGYGGARQLDLTWTESGVPAVPVSPKRKGFGRELIEEALPYRLGAKTKLEFVGNGVRCRISVDLPGDGLGS